MRIPGLICVLLGAGLLLLAKGTLREGPRQRAPSIEAVPAPAVPGPGDPSLGDRARQALRLLPVAFVPNLGQWEEASHFVARRGPVSVHAFADSFGVVLTRADQQGRSVPGSTPSPGALPRAQRVEATAIRFWFEASAGGTRPEGRAPLPTRFHYLLGSDPARWRADVTSYRSLWYPGLYAGVDLALRGGEDGDFEYDLHLAPGANLGSVVVRIDGATAPLRVDEDGALVVTTRLGTVRQPRPRAWEETDQGPRPVDCSYEILGPSRFRFRAQGVGGDVAFVIDPQLHYSTYLGGNHWDEVFALAADARGEVVLVGRTFSADFPTRNALQSSIAGSADVFIARLALTGGPPVYSTYLGGSGEDEARAVALDASGGPVVAGATTSSDFPTRNAFQTSNAGFLDAFVLHLSPAGGALAWSTYCGGRGIDAAVRVALDANGAAVLAGGTSSPDFPMRNAWQTSNAGGYDAFVARLPLAGGPPTYSTYFGGSADDSAVSVALDASGDAVIAGFTGSADLPTRNAFQPSLAGMVDAFVARLPLTGGPPGCSTYLGGDGADYAFALALDAGGVAVVTGGTTSTDFPTRSAFQTSLAGPSDAFVTRLALSGAPPIASTYLGGASTETALALALDTSGGAVVAGWTFSPDFPTQDAFQARPAGGAEVFLTRLSPAGGPPTYSTYLGGNGLDKAYALSVDARRAALVVGLTDSTNFPTHNALQTRLAGFYDVFVTHLDLLPPGASSFGSSTPGCSGPLPIGASSIPRVGNAAFALTCERGPAHSTGLLALSSAGLATPLVLFGTAIWIDPAAPALLVAFASSDASGAARAPVPIPPSGELVGARAFAQFFWPDACTAGGVSASNALQVTVQP